jgi:hypothetical protein
MTSYVGLDVGLRSTSVCIVDHAGAVLMERNVLSEVEDIARVIRSTGVVVEAVALETGNLTPWLTAALRAEGFRVVVLEARQGRPCCRACAQDGPQVSAPALATQSGPRNRFVPGLFAAFRHSARVHSALVCRSMPSPARPISRAYSASARP